MPGGRVVAVWLLIGGSMLTLSSCAPMVSGPRTGDNGNVNAPANRNANTSINANRNVNGTGPATRDKFALWTDGTQLRGANIFQRRVYPDLDGPDFLGPGPLGPPYTQADFDQLAALGANYVNISHTGIFSQAPPYQVDPDVQANLDRLLDMIAAANMFAVISFRSGPERGEFALIQIPGLPPELTDQSVWQNQAAQDGWAAMWRYTAERYRGNPIVVGYDLMVEPNAPALLNIFNPSEFYLAYAGAINDWNRFYPGVLAAIRAVDEQTPVLVAANGFSAVNWLPSLQPTADARTVYAVHPYEPGNYTTQDPQNLTLRYPDMFDADGDGTIDQVDRAWLQNELAPIETFARATGMPVAANEFGAQRWEPGAANYVSDEMDIFEQLGINYAVWLWMAAHPPAAEDDAFNLRHGPDPNNHAEVTSELLDGINSHWQRNTARPSP
ncbi:MAG TPA: cellulase family glycosylhydrolase [Phycisphaerae bacterium]|jgi:hypothetical protein